VEEEDRRGEAVRREGVGLDKEFMKNIRIRATDMASPLERRVFRSAREVFDTMSKGISYVATGFKSFIDAMSGLIRKIANCS
jgi:hypothetical protein